MSQQPPNWHPGTSGQPQYPSPVSHPGYGGGYSQGSGYGPAPQGHPLQGGYGPGPFPHGPPPQYGAPPGNWPQQPPVQQPQSGVSLGRIVLGVIVGFVILIFFGYILSSITSPKGNSLTFGNGSLPEAPKLTLRSPQIVTDEDFVVSAGGAQMRGFTIPSTRPVKVSVEGKQDTAKGFNVYVMEDSDWTKFKAEQRFEYVPSLSSLKTRSYAKTKTLPAGSWCVVVQNSENILNDMTVHVQVVVDPE